MKSIRTLFSTIVTVLILSSCNKGELKDAVNNAISNTTVTFGFEIAGVPVAFTFGGGNGYYWDQRYYNSYNYGTSWKSITTLCYIISKPSDPEHVVVYDKFNNQIGVVRCDQGQGATTNEVFLRIRNWFDQNPGGKCTVPVTFPIVPFTHGGEWTGTIYI